MNFTPGQLTVVANTIVKRIRHRIRENKVKPSTPTKYKTNGKPTLTESGKLLRSIKYTISDQKITITAGGAGIPYARIHHEGGRIFPKTAKYLAIPLTKAAKVASPRDFKETFFVNNCICRTARNADGKIIKKNGKPKVIALYKLKKFVDIPARPYMFLDKQDEDYIIERLKEYTFPLL